MQGFKRSATRNKAAGLTLDAINGLGATAAISLKRLVFPHLFTGLQIAKIGAMG
jgi:hypothetical protein